MEVCMSVKPDFSTMDAAELRTHVLAHRDDQEALQAYLDRLRSSNEGSRVYQPEDNVAEAIEEYLRQRQG
jgi:hypothetical protein